MLKWFKRERRQELPEGEKGDPLISAVLLEGGEFAFAELQNQLAGARVGIRRPTDLGTEKEILHFQLGDEMGFVALMPPYPWSDLEGPCETSWMWPEHTPAAGLKEHKAHLLATLIGGSSGRIARHLMLTQLTALAAGQPGVMGVYWPYATMVHYPPVFIEMTEAATVEEPPLYLWVDFRLFGNEDGSVGLFTTGMAPLGRMEIEIPRIRMEPGGLREWAINIAYYLLEKGSVLKDGDTIGATAEERIRVRHRPSQFGHEGTVICLEP